MALQEWDRATSGPDSKGDKLAVQLETAVGGPPGPPKTVRVLRGRDSLEGLREDWASIANPWTSPTEGPEWVRSWADVYGVDQELTLFVAGDPVATAIAPLVRSGDGGPWLESVGPARLGEATGFAFSDPASVLAVAEALAASRLPLRLWRVPADSPLVDALKRAYRRRGLVLFRPAPGCPSLPLDESWTDPEEHLDKRRRSNLRRCRRLAERIGPVIAEILSPRPEEVGPLLAEAYAVEEAGWKSRTGSPLARDASVGEFLRRFARAAAGRGMLRVCFLRIGGRAAAMKIAAVTGGRFWLLAMGFSTEFERCSPGALLLHETIRYAARCGLRSYEFLGSDEPWIRPWTNVVRPCVLVRAYPLSTAGAAAVASDAGTYVRLRIRGLRARGRRLLGNVGNRLGPAYVAGPSLEDALIACRSLDERGFRTTIGYMATDDDDPRSVADQYVRLFEAIRSGGLDCYASLKAPALGFSVALLAEIAHRAHASNVGLCFDAVTPHDVEATFDAIDRIRGNHDDLACALAGGWRRSMGDAERAIERGLKVRVVRGEHPDGGRPAPSPRAGFLAVVDRVAGRVPHVAVATHDPTLARAAIRRLRSSRTPVELEVLMGYPVHRVVSVARSEEVPVRMYVPYGRVTAPYSLSDAVRRPRVLGWTLRDSAILARYPPPRSPGIPERYGSLGRA